MPSSHENRNLVPRKRRWPGEAAARASADHDSSTGRRREHELVTEHKTGIRAMLRNPKIYTAFQRLVGDTKLRTSLVDEYLDVTKGARILDAGCGPGNMVPFLMGTDYVGFDPSPQYIAAARERYGDHGTFHVATADEMAAQLDDPVDRMIAVGVLHHVSNDQVVDILSLARDTLVPGGRLVTVDPAFDDDQRRVARWIIARDRGQAVRTGDELRKLANSVLGPVDVDIRHDLINIPYTHAVLTWTR